MIKRWEDGDLECVVATIAFGMVSFVRSIPQSSAVSSFLAKQLLLTEDRESTSRTCAM